MTVKMEVLEQQAAANPQELQGEPARPSGEYAVNDNGNPVSGPVSSPAPVSIAVDKVAPHQVEEFGNRETLTAIEIAKESQKVPSQRVATALQAARLLDSVKDDRLNSDNLDENFKAIDDHSAYRREVEKEVDNHIREENRRIAHFELTRKSRGFFTKIADFASNIWSGTTPEDRAKGKQGVGGIRGFFMGEEQLREALVRRAGIEEDLRVAPVQKPSLIDGIESTASRIVSGIGGFFKKFLPSKPTAKKLAAVGALATGIVITGGSSCGKGCTGNHPGHDQPVASSSTGGEGGAAPAPSQTVAEVPSGVPSAVASTDLPPAPTVDKPLDKSEKDKETKKAPAPKLAKVSTLPKHDVLPHPPKKTEEPKKVEQPKSAELKDCTPNQVLTDADLGKCLVPGEDAEKLRKSFYAQADEQQKALEGVFAPIANGPEYVTSQVYKRDKSQITFLAGQGVADDPENPNLIWKQNAANKKIVADALTAVRTRIAEAKTPKDFYDITEVLARIGERIDVLIAERGKQIAASVDAANALNTQHAKDRIADVEKNSGKKINAVPFSDQRQGTTVKKSTIDLPMTRRLLDGSEADMLAPARGEDPDKVIASVQKKLEYYRGLLQLNTNLDDVRVKQRPASARMADVLKGGPTSGVQVKPGPKLTAYAK